MGQASGAKIDIRRFLKDCGACGAAKGFLHLPGSDASVRVSCRCDIAQCPRCGRQMMIAPVPLIEDDIGGGSWEAGLVRARCASCGPLYANFFRES